MPITNEKLKNKVNYFSEIRLLIIGKGSKTILNDNFIFEPFDVKINGESKNCKKVCDLQNNLNNVILYFNNSITSCENMFYLLKDIIEIDLSKFDFTCVTTMKNMFKNCSLLERVDFGNINTSSLENMESMFNGCSNLISIDLSKFNTNKVKSFQSIFNQCKKIKLINLGNMNTSSTINMRSFFKYCEKGDLTSRKIGNIREFRKK